MKGRNKFFALYEIFFIELKYEMLPFIEL